MDFDRICTIFTLQEPYYGILLSAMDRFPTRVIPTMGVCRSGNVFKLGYNPDFISDKDLDTMMCLLKHETIHVAFNVFTMFDDEASCKAEQQLRNLAADLEANCYVDWSRAKGVHPMLVQEFGFQEKLGTREYYKQLLQMNQQQQQQQAKNPPMPCNGGKGGQSQSNQQMQSDGQDGDESDEQDQSQSQNGNPQNGQGGNNSQQDIGLSQQMQDAVEQAIDDHSMWPDDMTEEDMENLNQVIEDMLIFAAEEVEKGRGTIPAELVGKITDIRNKKKPKPVTDWKKYFRRYIGNEFSDVIKKSRKRESKRFPDAAGNRHKRKSHILVAIDTSGSVSMPEYREFFGQLRTMRKDMTFHVVECDAKIQHQYEFNGTIHEELHGGGGTSFQPPVDMYLANRRKYEGLVYFTDGGAPIPSDTPKETLWVVSSKGDHDRARYKVNGASVVFIPKQD